MTEEKGSSQGTEVSSEEQRPAGQWTPWPWHVHDALDSPLHLIWTHSPAGQRDVLVARTCFAPASEANARLIAAAPELYEALKDMLGALEALADDVEADTRGPCPAHDIDLCGEPLCRTSGCIVWRCQVARAALAKADGRQ